MKKEVLHHRFRSFLWILLIAVSMVSITSCSPNIDTDAEDTAAKEAVQDTVNDLPLSEDSDINEPTTEPSTTTESSTTTEPSTAIEPSTLLTEPSKPSTEHIVLFTDKGFDPSNITISSGDTVVWKNARTKIQAVLLGTRGCSSIRSPALKRGDEYQWTFSTPMTCTVVDAVFTATVMKVVVQE